MQYCVVSKATSSKSSKKFKATKINPTLDSLKLMDPPPVRPPPTFVFNKDFNGRSIQHKWFADRNWLEYDSGLLFCSVCRRYSNQLPGWNSIMSKSQDTFSTVGYSGNRKALDKFKVHENSAAHGYCMEIHEAKVSSQQSLASQLNEQVI